MKIKAYKVPVTLKRDALGNPEAELHEDQKTELSSEDIQVDTSRIPNIAKELADSNNIQLTIAKNSMLKDETESKATIIFKYLA